MAIPANRMLFLFLGNVTLNSLLAIFSAKNCHFDESARGNPVQIADIRMELLGGSRNDTNFANRLLKFMPKLAGCPTEMYSFLPHPDDTVS